MTARRAQLCASLALLLASSHSVVATGASSIRMVDETVSVRRTHASPTIRVELDDLFSMTSFTFTGRRVTVGGMNSTRETAVYVKTHSTRRTSGSDTIVSWHGMMAEPGRVGFATLLQTNETVIGTISTATTVYEIGQWANGTRTVQTKLWTNVLDGEGYDWDERDALLISSSRTKQASDTVSLQAVRTVPLDTSETITTSLGAQQAVTTTQRHGWNVFDRSAVRSAATNHIVDVLVLVTNRALCQVAGARGACPYSETNARPLQDKLTLAVEQTNAAMRAADIPVTIRLVEVIHLEATYDANPGVATLELLRTSAQIQQWMNDAGADLVCMLTGSLPSGFDAAGTAYIDRPESVVSVDYLATYTFTHEIGHNFGCRHNRGACPSSHAYGHALQVPFQFRTVMAYQCDVYNSCPRIPFYSAAGYFYNGVAMGDATTDNARVIREKAARVANFRAPKQSPPPVRSPSPGPVRSPTRRTVPVPAPVPVRGPPVPVPVRGPVPVPRRAPVPVRGVPTSAPKRRPAPVRRRPTRRPTTRPSEPPQLAIIPTLTCGTETSTQCPGKNLMNAMTASMCTEYCVAEAYVAFWTRLGRSCGPCAL